MAKVMSYEDLDKAAADRRKEKGGRKQMKYAREAEDNAAGEVDAQGAGSSVPTVHSKRAQSNTCWKSKYFAYFPERGFRSVRDRQYHNRKLSRDTDNASSGPTASSASMPAKAWTDASREGWSSRGVRASTATTCCSSLTALGTCPSAWYALASSCCDASRSRCYAQSEAR